MDVICGVLGKVTWPDQDWVAGCLQLGHDAGRDKYWIIARDLTGGGMSFSILPETTMKIIKDAVTISGLEDEFGNKGQTVHLKNANAKKLELFSDKLPPSIKDNFGNMSHSPSQTSLSSLDSQSTQLKKSKECRERKSSSSNNKKGAKRKITKDDIGKPENFQHIGHIGWDRQDGFDIDNMQMDDNWKKLFDLVGVTEEQKQSKETMEFIYDFVEKRGGIENVVREMEMEKKREPPSLPSSDLERVQDLREADSPRRTVELDRQLREFQQREENSQRQLMEMQRQFGELQEREQNLQRQLRETREQLANCQGQVSELQLSLTTAQLTINGLRSQETRDWVISRNAIQMTNNCVGRGGWGSVYEGTYCGCTVAVKQIYESILSPYNRLLFEREMNIASKCRHPHLLQFIGATNDEGSPLFVTELMEKSLRALLEQRQLSETEIVVISLDVARALNYLHQKKPEPIIHRDVSSANVLLWRQGNQWRGKVSDYGTVNFMQQTMTVAPGAMIYSAPEALTPNQTDKVDVYSFGVLLCEMCIRQLPDTGRREEQVVLVTSSVLRGLVRRCLQRDPGTRPTMQEIIDELNDFNAPS